MRFSANISNRSSIVRYGSWCCCCCFGFGVCGVGGQVFGAVSVHVDTGFGVGTGRREGFGALTGREAISAQDICFRGVAIGVGVAGGEGTSSDVETGVAGGVRGSEVWEVDSDWLTGGVSINAGSLGGGGVAGGVGIAATAFGVGSGVVGVAVSLSMVSAGSLGVVTADSLGVVTAGSLGVGFAVSLAGFSVFWW